MTRRFRSELAGTVQQEIRRARVERARQLLEGSESSLLEVAKQCGFATAALLSVAFQRELGLPPGVYRRRYRDALAARNE